jgi:hypothetical protein
VTDTRDMVVLRSCTLSMLQNSFMLRLAAQLEHLRPEAHVLSFVTTTCCRLCCHPQTALCRPADCSQWHRLSNSLRLTPCRWIIDSRDELTPERLKNLDDAFKLYR